jgi:hypothetical protein
MANDLAQGLSGSGADLPTAAVAAGKLDIPRSTAVGRAATSVRQFLRRPARCARRSSLPAVVDGIRGQWHRRRPAGDAGAVLCCRCAAGRSVERRFSGPVLRQRRRLSAAVGGARQALWPRGKLGGLDVRRCRSLLSGPGGSAPATSGPLPSSVCSRVRRWALTSRCRPPCWPIFQNNRLLTSRRKASRRRPAPTFGWWNLVAKLNLALAAGLSLPLLDLVGYQPGVDEATRGLAAVYCLLPLFFKTTAAVLAWRWRKTLEVC